MSPPTLQPILVDPLIGTTTTPSLGTACSYHIVGGGDHVFHHLYGECVSHHDCVGDGDWLVRNHYPTLIPTTIISQDSQDGQATVPRA